MEIGFDEVALQDIQYWKKSGNTAIQEKIQKLLTAIKEEPYSGIGKPEALKYSLIVNGQGGLIMNTELSIQLGKALFKSIPLKAIMIED